MKRHFTFLLTLAAAVCLAGTATADDIAVANSSFEEPDLSTGNTWTNTYPGWDAPADTGQAFVELIGGFAADGAQHIGIDQGAEVSQDVGVGLLADTTYALTVAIGHRDGFVDPTLNGTTFGLYLGADAADGGVLLQDRVVDASAIPAGTFGNYSLLFTTGGTVDPGNIFVSLSSADNGSTQSNRGHFDNVRLSIVPEPGTLILSAAGLLAGLGFRRRQG